MDTIKDKSALLVKGGIATAGLLYAFYTVIDLMFFLSNPNYANTYKQTVNDKWTWSLIVNIILLSVFVLQHTVLALPEVKNFFTQYHMKDVQRSLYIILTCASLELLISKWQYISTITFWEFSLDSHAVYWLYMITHGFSWMLIYIGTICMDVNELLGIKQIYYSLQQLPEPLAYKTIELQKLYSHMRHPSFIGFIVIFWFVPVLRLDRILLAAFLSLYMYIAWKTDDKDLAYQKRQYARKFQ